MTPEEELSKLREIIKNMTQKNSESVIEIRKALKSVEDSLDAITWHTEDFPIEDTIKDNDDKIMDHDIT